MGRGRPKKRSYLGNLKNGHTLSSGRASVIPVGEKVRKRLSSSLCDLALKNTGLNESHELPGITLRPAKENNEIGLKSISTNEVIDLEKQQIAYKHAHSAHRSFSLARRSTRHIPTLVMKKVSNKGFGTSVCFKCQNCSFVSEKYDLFATTASGACVTNAQSGVAFSKTCVKPSEAEFLFNALNISCPSRNTLQKHFNQANKFCGQVLEDTLVENRGFLRDFVSVTSSESPTPSACPSVAVSFDGQFNKPVYHGFDGKATSVSQPVMEEETNLHLLVGHSIVSKKDGSYAQEKVSWSVGWSVGRSVGWLVGPSLARSVGHLFVSRCIGN